MGDPNVFEFNTYSGILMGISWEWYGGALSLNILIPFIAVSIYFKKTKNNGWF